MKEVSLGSVREYILGIILTVFILVPAWAEAAYNDVNFDPAGAQITLSNGTLIVGGEIASSTVSVDSIDVDLLPNSTVTFWSNSRMKISATGGTVTQDFQCLPDQSKLTLKNSTATSTVTVTISETCNSGGGGGGGGGGGSGNSENGSGSGGGSSGDVVPPPPVTNSTVATPAAPVQPTVPPPPAPPVGVPAPKLIFDRDLDLGSEGDDVRELQVFLNAHGFKIVDTGPGSLSNETQFFGRLTKKALAAYQEARGITPPKGYFGSKTRERVNVELGAIPVVSPAPATSLPISSTFDADLKVGFSGEAVRRLQILLNSDLDTRIAETGPGSPGNESDFFGTRTKAAVARFQAKHGLPQVGKVGPATRAKLGEVFISNQSPETLVPSPIDTVTVPPPSSEIVTLQAQLDAANAQLQLLLQQSL